MELLCTPDHFVFVDKERSLVCDRNDGTIRFMSAEAMRNEIYNATCLGIFYGIVGKFQAHQDYEKKLVLIQKRKAIGKIYGGHEVYKIQKISLLSILPGDIPDIDLEPCPIHLHISSISPSSSVKRSAESTSLHKTWTNIKSATSSRKPKDKDRLEKKICDALLFGPSPHEFCLPGLLLMALDDAFRLGRSWAQNYWNLHNQIEREFIRMFNETSSFYYSLTGDITTSLQRQEEQKSKTPFNDNIPLWRRVDDRFFWNKYMMTDLIESWDVNADPWIIPIIQGFVQIEPCTIDTSSSDFGSTTPSPKDPQDHFQPLSSLKEYTMILISRRSRFRAGTRYKRRGVDESGKVANYVETEQIFLHGPHAVSFVQVRGSVPVFWSQPGSRYRPPPRLDRTETETREAFKRHFEDELSIYKSQVIVSLVEQTGRERVICNTYLKHIIELNSPNLTYVAFDFHDYCRGMKFENVSILIDTIQDIIKDMKYCWVDQHGMILEQNGVFRVNCIDCLDRTNIVQTALAKSVMDIQFTKLGLLPPEGELPVSCRRIFQILWANNGDIISRQYAGTAALKGDFTRTGERKFTGVMKDGYNSASRYYMNRFKDEYRQLTIDLMLGNATTADIANLSPPEDKDELDLENSERVRLLIEDTKRILVPESEPVIGGWALIDADPVTGDPNQTEMDTIVILTQDCYYVVEYDEQTDRVTSYEKVMLEDLEKIELGPEPSLFKSKHTIMRLHYQVYGQSGYFHSFRNANFRFFNNIVVPIKTDEQAAEALKVICDTLIFALSNKSLNVPFFQGKLEKRKSKVIQCTSSNNCPPASSGMKRGLFGGIHLDLPSLASMPRNISDGHLVSAGTRAFSHILSPIRGFVGNRNKGPPSVLSASSINAATLQHPLDSNLSTNLQHQSTANQNRAFYTMDTSSESEDDSPFLPATKSDSEALQHQHSNDFTQSSEFSECSDGEEAGPNGITIAPVIKDDTSLHDTMLESCGILATSSGSNDIIPQPRSSSKQAIDVDDFVIESMRKNSGRFAQRNKNFIAGDGIPYQRPNSLYVSLEEETDVDASYLPPHSIMPEIHICTDALTPTGSSKNDDNLVFKSSRGPSSKLSKSSEDLDRPASTQVTFSSNDVSHLLVQEETSLDSDGLSNKMKTSHSESAIQEFSTFHLPNPLSSPIAIKKDLVLSPLSRIAKGVQNLGINLRHGANHVALARRQTTGIPEDLGISEEQRRKCQTRIIVI